MKLSVATHMMLRYWYSPAVVGAYIELLYATLMLKIAEMAVT